MKIAVIGCGAMGSIYAARLAAAGHDVLAIDSHQPSIEQIARAGLRVTGPGYDRTVQLRAATTAPAETMDLIVLAVKAANVEDGAQQALPMLGPDTPVLTIQNGLGSAEIVAGIVGDQRVAVGIASGFGASRVAPGHVHHNAMRAMRFGSYSSLPHPTVESIARTWTQAGFDAAAVTDIAPMQWEKLICNVAYSAPCALTGMTVGQVMDDPEMGAVSRAAATEAWTVAQASAIAISVTDPVAHVRDFGAGMPDAKPSALLDHEARRVSEIDVINGAVPRQGARVGVEAPVNATLTALVKAIERQWRVHVGPATV
ncbi:2-dehydropantoate 2-reductase [Mycobacterium sp. 852002-51163_SCH5372311]|uniref:ketopantoate reductase family protein n=1 Tax=Mycobacterium sp. 852002-51163_SCH5372311 TaxID=1834097 RepID=UPI0007FC158C|nr:2-dehydropantoate 2-reductase [Mycobacterium sp. 852002-51163_SCH5372311]OBF81627.1 2-dehydropantoate 2-reductase [Mycobacterium sp. 852002-51163_SCH5372311]